MLGHLHFERAQDPGRVEYLDGEQGGPPTVDTHTVGCTLGVSQQGPPSPGGRKVPPPEDRDEPERIHARRGANGRTHRPDDLLGV